jgi:prepilin-type N-terminal cleavage/methylation domain-containing protein
VSRWRRQDGFSLIELAVSLSLFAIVVASLSLMFDRALETGTRVRFDQVGKTLAQDRLEELRALPFYVPWTDEARRVDLLDLYYPNTTGAPVIPGTTASYDGSANVWRFTTTENPLVVENKQFTRSTSVQFVGVQENGTVTPKAPNAGYASDVADSDSPAAHAVMLTVGVDWVSQSQNRTVSLDTVIHNIRRGVPNVQASGSALAAQLSGVVFHDGDNGTEGTTAEILAAVGEATTSFREVTGSESDASADPIDVLERDPVNGVLLQGEAPTAPGGAAASSAPNSATGDTAADSTSLAAGSMGSLDAVGALAAWGSTSPSAATEARVSALHTQNPEGRAAVNVSGFVVNSRDPTDDEDDPPLRMFELGNVAGVVEERSTPNQVRVDSSVDLTTIPADGGNPARPAVTIWASKPFVTHPEYEGVVTIDRLEVDVHAFASTTTATTAVDWHVDGLRVWDPLVPSGNVSDPLGGYSVAYNFGFDSTCGGWEDNPLTPLVEDPAAGFCGTTRIDQTKAPTENPNPVIIPLSYVGTDGTSTSLSIVAGVTVRDTQADAAAGTASASVAQKNILSITTRNDVQGATPLEQMLVGVGDAGADASYIVHEH